MEENIENMNGLSLEDNLQKNEEKQALQEYHNMAIKW